MNNSLDIIAKIDLNAVAQNYQRAVVLAKDSQVIPVIKANAYGHGALQVAQRLQHAQRFAVARFSEAQALREQGITQNIIVLSNPLTTENILLASHNNFEPVVYSEADLLLLLATLENTPLALPLNIWLKIDTGMHRLGLCAEELQQYYPMLDKQAGIKHIFLMSHFATADAKNTDFLQEQLATFKSIHSAFPQLPYSLANSAALLRDQKYHGQWVRPGIMLYGVNPLLQHNSDIQLTCTMELTAPVIAIRSIKSGESVGYNRSWHAGRISKIATLAIGYADGYPRHAKNGTPIGINGKVVPLVGTVSMDMISVDVTDIANIAIGARAELWGPQISVVKVAQCSATIAYQLFTGLSGRTQKIYAAIA